MRADQVTVTLTVRQANAVLVAIDDHFQHLSDNDRIREANVLRRADGQIREAIRKVEK